MTRQPDRTGEASGHLPAHTPSAFRERLQAELKPVIDRLAARYGIDNGNRELLTDLLNTRLDALLAENPSGDTPLRPFLVRGLTAFAKDCSRRSINGSVQQGNKVNDDHSEAASVAPDVHDLFERGREIAPLPEAITQLPAEQREVMLLRYAGSRSVEEIAEKLRITTAQARTRLRQGLTELRNRYWSLEN
jgi:RNA polymerase sigma factor (sigma-70 family)